jgi:hypothetical protein
MMAKKTSKWDKRIQKAEKFFETSLQHGRNVYTRYKDDRQAGGMNSGNGVYKANIFYANVSTIKESLFNSLPKPDVRRLHNSDYDDDVSRVAALIVSRALDYELQCAKDFRGSVKSAILDRLVPGIGQVWLRFDVGLDDQGNPAPKSEAIFIETVYWEDFIYEPARTWDKVGWCGRRLELDEDECKKRWGDKVVNLQAARNMDSSLTPKQIGEDKYYVYEIWDKTTKKVIFTAMGLDEPLEEKPDPYGLLDFFPCPPPLVANLNTTAFLPVTDYHIAQDQYLQLDVLYARMSMIVDAIRVAGLYDAASPEIGKMLQGKENQLIPVDNWAMYMEKGGAKGLIDWYPLEVVVTVLQELQKQFEAVKGILFEVTGMSDIIRGDSNQYETAKAQEIKSQFASIRMNGYSRDVADFVTGVLNIMAQLVCSLYSDEKLRNIVGMLNTADEQYVPQAVPIIRDNFVRHYKVSIQADSLTQADWALEKSAKMELMGYVSQFLQSAVSVIGQTPELAPLLIGLLKFTVTGFRGAGEIEGLIDAQMDAMQKAQAAAKANPQPPQPTPEQIKQQTEQMKAQAEVQKIHLEAQIAQETSKQSAMLEQQRSQFDMQIEQQKLELQSRLAQQEATQKAELELQKAQLQSEMLRAKMDHENALQVQKLAFMREEQQLKLQGAMAQAQLKAESQAVDHQQKQSHADEMQDRALDAADEETETDD